jgi:hypothetical protein
MDAAAYAVPPQPVLVDPAVAQAHVVGLLRWLKDESFVLSIAEWSWDWCVEFPKMGSSPHDVEHSLRWTEVHKEYRNMFESRAQMYLHHHGLTGENFLKLAVNFLDHNPELVTSEIFEGLVASEDYFSFFNYMCTVRARREWAEATLAAASDELDWPALMRRSLMSDLGDVSDAYGELGSWPAGCPPEQPHRPRHTPEDIE